MCIFASKHLDLPIHRVAKARRVPEKKQFIRHPLFSPVEKMALVRDSSRAAGKQREPLRLPNRSIMCARSANAHRGKWTRGSSYATAAIIPYANEGRAD